MSKQRERDKQNTVEALAKDFPAKGLGEIMDFVNDVYDCAIRWRSIAEKERATGIVHPRKKGLMQRLKVACYDFGVSYVIEGELYLKLPSGRDNTFSGNGLWIIRVHKR